MVLKKTPESPLDSKEIKPVNSKGNQPWIFTGRTDAEAETPILWLPDAKSGLTGKDPDSGKDWRQEDKGEIRERDDWTASLSQWTWVERAPEMVKDRETWRAAVHWVAKSQTQLSDWARAFCGTIGQTLRSQDVLCRSLLLLSLWPACSGWDLPISLVVVGLRVTIPHKALLLTSCGHTLRVRKTNLKCFQSLRVWGYLLLWHNITSPDWCWCLQMCLTWTLEWVCPQKMNVVKSVHDMVIAYFGSQARHCKCVLECPRTVLGTSSASQDRN